MPTRGGMIVDRGELIKVFYADNPPEKLFIDSDGDPLEIGLYEVVPKVTPLFFTGDFTDSGAVFLDYHGTEYAFSREKLLGCVNRFTEKDTKIYISSLQSLICWLESAQNSPKLTKMRDFFKDHGCPH